MSFNRADIVAVIGSTGSGKSRWIKARLKADLPVRLLVWSPLEPSDRYGKFGHVIERKPGALVEYVAARRGGSFRAVYVPDRARGDAWLERQFELFCGLAIAAKSCLVIVEELSMVTKPQRAPARWREVITTGRHYGLSIIGTSQRPALVDKTFFSNATMIRCGKLSAASDKKTMSDSMDVPLIELRALVNGQWIVKDAYSGAIAREDDPIAKAPRRRAAEPAASS